MLHPTAMAAAQAPASQVPAPESPKANAAGGIDAVRAAVEDAREDARRNFASTAAAAAAWARLERLRAPLLESDDPRAAAWLADAAEDALTVGLSIDSCGATTIVGIPSAAQRDRATTLLGDALARTRAAERSARAAISAGTATPAGGGPLDPFSSPPQCRAGSALTSVTSTLVRSTSTLTGTSGDTWSNRSSSNT